MNNNSSKQSAKAVAWKNSPVKTFFPEEFKRSQSVDDSSKSHHKSILLHQDDEIYSMLLSRASSSFFDDDNDNKSRRDAAQRYPVALSTAGDVNSVNDVNGDTRSNGTNGDSMSSDDSDEERCMDEGTTERNTVAAAYSSEDENPRPSLYKNFIQLATKSASPADAKRRTQDEIINTTRPSTHIEFDTNKHNHHQEQQQEEQQGQQQQGQGQGERHQQQQHAVRAVEYTRNEELMSTDYELLQYIDFLDGIEKEFPAVADVSNNVDFTSCDLLAQSVMEKVCA
jgi:hypothetical protein